MFAQQVLSWEHGKLLLNKGEIFTFFACLWGCFNTSGQQRHAFVAGLFVNTRSRNDLLLKTLSAMFDLSCACQNLGHFVALGLHTFTV